MTWIHLFYGVGMIVGTIVVISLVREVTKIAREKDDYDDSVELPD